MLVLCRRPTCKEMKMFLASLREHALDADGNASEKVACSKSNDEEDQNFTDFLPLKGQRKK